MRRIQKAWLGEARGEDHRGGAVKTSYDAPSKVVHQKCRLRGPTISGAQNVTGVYFTVIARSRPIYANT